MKRLIRIVLLLIILSTLLALFGKDIFKPGTIRAFGDLTVDFHVPLLDPIFTVNNMAPGDIEDRNVDVTNGGTVPRMVAVKGVKTGGIGDDPKLETVLEIVIKEGAQILYGPVTVEQFFTQSNDPNGIQLNVINPGELKTYNFIVTFPQGAGNEFQAKSVIFDLTFGVVTGKNVVINEVYYVVDPNHGLDSPKDRGILGIKGNNITIKKNGAGSTNTVVVKQSEACKILQSNNTTANTTVNSLSNTGLNSFINNLFSNITSSTGNAKSAVVVTVNGGNNISSADCGKMLGQNDEWIELFNPTDRDINLKNWSFTDNSGTSIKINANRIIKAGGFALVTKDDSVWQNWNETPQALKIPLGAQIGDGLDNIGDRLIMKNPAGQTVDALSWGNDKSIFDIPNVEVGKSLERIVPGFDTDTAIDWKENVPTPGN